MYLFGEETGSLKPESKEADTGVYGFTISAPGKKIKTKKSAILKKLSMKIKHKNYMMLSVYVLK